LFLCLLPKFKITPHRTALFFSKRVGEGSNLIAGNFSGRILDRRCIFLSFGFGLISLFAFVLWSSLLRHKQVL
jgi:hypothetical protein